MSKMHGKWIHKDNSLTVDPAGNLAVKLQIPEQSLLETTADGIRVIPNTVIKPDGTVPFTGNQSLAGFKLTNVGLPTADTDSANKAYVDGVIGGATTRSTQVDVIVLTSTDITNKYATLTFPVSDASEVSLDIVHGSIQAPNQDFRIDLVDRKVLRWNGQGLDGILAAGDTLIVTYPRTVAVATPLIPVEGLTRVYGELRFDASTVDTYKTAVSPLRFMGVHSSVAFAPDTDGGIVFTLPVSDQYVQATDIRFRINYGVPTADATSGAFVTLVGEVYVTEAGETAVLGTPTFTFTDTLVIGDTNNVLLSGLLTNIKIPGSSLDGTGKVITVRLYRDTAADNYQSDFCLVSLNPQQTIA